MDGGRNGHDDAKPVVHESKVRNPHRGEKFQQPRGEDEEEHHFQQTGEETEDATRRCHNAKHLGGEPNMAEGTRDHEEAGSSMHHFQHFVRFKFNAVLFEMKKHARDKTKTNATVSKRLILIFVMCFMMQYYKIRFCVCQFRSRQRRQGWHRRWRCLLQRPRRKITKKFLKKTVDFAKRRNLLTKVRNWTSKRVAESSERFLFSLQTF